MNENSNIPLNSDELMFPSKLIKAQVENKQLVQKNHRKIIEAGVKLFGQSGYHTTTIRQIVKESGIGIGSIYQYVKNKEEILVLILEYFLNLFEYELSKATEVNNTPTERLKIGVKKYYNQIDNGYEKIILAYSSTISLSRPYKEFVKELEVKTNKVFEDILKEGIKTNEFSSSINVPLVAYNIIMIGHMWALKRWYFRGKMTIDQYINEQLKYIMSIVQD